VIEAGKGAQHEIVDILLTRYACYLIAQNGDSRKEEIAFAQNYFAIQTRRAELVEKRILEFERVKAREKLSQTENQLSLSMFFLCDIRFLIDPKLYPSKKLSNANNT